MMESNILRYLGIPAGEAEEDLLGKIDQGKKEVEANSSFKAYHRFFDLKDMQIEGSILLESEDLHTYLAGCDQVMLSAYTLGISMERFLKRLQAVDMTSAVIYDAVASAYLEQCADRYDEEALGGKVHTYRFAPGYGDIPLSLNRELGKLLDIHKYLGITMTESGLFLPQKSMLCITGIGSSSMKKSCEHCVRYHQCKLREKGERCYSID